MNKTDKRILYVTNLPAPYRVEFFNDLSKYTALTVLYLFEKGEYNRSWDITDYDHDYTYEVLPEVKLHQKIRYNPSLHHYLKSHEFDCYIVGSYTGIGEIITMRYARKAGKPLLINSDGGFINEQESPLKRAVKNRLLAMGDIHLASGINAEKTLLHHNVDPGKIVRYPFSSIRDAEVLKAPVPETERQAYAASLGLPSDRMIVLSIGQFITRKNLAYLLNTALVARDDQIQFVFIGEGPLQDEYRSFIDRHTLTNVTLVPYQGRETLWTYYRAAHLLMLMSWMDTWGLVVNEAIANGLPVVTSPYVGASYDLIAQNENGYIVGIDQPDYQQMRDTILAIREDPDMNRRSLEIARKYTIEQEVAAHVDILQQVLKTQQ
ncbi:MAG: glycosyltransferase family 4 protein [Spirochaetia bacterium]|nr:glycosyltransferase family 4 protein [Spirochaetia bacterium]MCF7941085.1 glycosyltransferase family 4 protein [Spirochaetia bacterium]